MRTPRPLPNTAEPVTRSLGAGSRGGSTRRTLPVLSRLFVCPAILAFAGLTSAQTSDGAGGQTPDEAAQQGGVGGDSTEPTAPDRAAEPREQRTLVEPEQRRQEAMPEQPQGLRGEVDAPLSVAMNAGIGSDLAYARRSIVELGGTLALVHESETTTFQIEPQLGYFLVDNLELSLFPTLKIIHLDDDTDVSVGATLEPSYHLPISDRIYVFAGLGLGLAYQEGPGVELLLRPRIGLDGLVGRSGIFKPSLFLDVGLDDGAIAGGVQAGFTVIL